MLKQIIFISLVFFCIQQNIGSTKIEYFPINKKQTTEDDSTQIIQTVRSFLTWYRDNYTTVNKIRLTYTDDLGNYQVDLQACTDYLNLLKSSGNISDEYVRLWMEYFQSRAVGFMENPQNEGPPEGFDYDLVVLTQEPELLINFVDKLTFSFLEKQEDFAVLSAKGEWPYVFELSKIKGKWVIDYFFIAEPEF